VIVVSIAGIVISAVGPRIRGQINPVPGKGVNFSAVGRPPALALGLYLSAALLIWLQARRANLFADASEKLVEAWRARAARSYPWDLRVAPRPRVITATGTVIADGFPARSHSQAIAATQLYPTTKHNDD
jgi:hypothetical protein